MQFVDVYDRSEIPRAPRGFRYLDFIGGLKEFRCFLVSHEMPRSTFLNDYKHLLDECLIPIYENNSIRVMQDASNPIPGFYILGFVEQYRSIDEVSDVNNLRSFMIIKELRKGMRNILDIPYIHLYYEEKPAKSCNVHYWILPVNVGGLEKHPNIYELDLMKYLSTFSFTKMKKEILDCNRKIRQYLIDINLIEKDNRLIQELGSLNVVER